MDEQNSFHLRNKIEIIYNYNHDFVPEYSHLDDLNEDELTDVYQQAVKRIKGDQTKNIQDIYGSILPFFEQAESRAGQPGNEFMAAIMLTTVKELIKGHIRILTGVEQTLPVMECLGLCQEIMAVEQNRAEDFFPLFRRYMLLMMDDKGEIPPPILGKVPSDIIEKVYDQTGDLPEMVPGEYPPGCILI